MIETIRWINSSIRIIDQSQLPEKEIYLYIKSVDELVESIKRLKIRGAPALGIAGAFGLVLTLQESINENKKTLLEYIAEAAETIVSSRPTAVNLRWGVNRVLEKIRVSASIDAQHLLDVARQEAKDILEEDIERCKAIGTLGSTLIQDGSTILTHCNAGGLATGGFGTALGVIVTAHMEQKKIKVIVDETRPVLQGSRLTAWELKKENIEYTVITDNMAGYLMSQKKINCVIVGADRIAINGDTANKIGTYTLAVLCEKHGIPLYVTAPTSTIDVSIKTGMDIPIEERDPDEVTHIQGNPVAPESSKVFNPAFDVTPAELITAIVTEKNIFHGPHYNFVDIV
jgi:methylthioribose-1-phosphate isomerase